VVSPSSGVEKPISVTRLNGFGSRASPSSGRGAAPRPPAHHPGPVSGTTVEALGPTATLQENVPERIVTFAAGEEKRINAAWSFATTLFPAKIWVVSGKAIRKWYPRTRYPGWADAEAQRGSPAMIAGATRDSMSRCHDLTIDPRFEVMPGNVREDTPWSCME
jgi:hypothetical protein